MKRILTSKVSGITFEGRQQVIATLKGDEPTRLVPQPDNPFDSNAIAVMVATTDGVKQVGFLPRDLAAQVAPYLDGEAIMCKLVEITGGFETWTGEVAALGLLIEIELPDNEDANVR